MAACFHCNDLVRPGEGNRCWVQTGSGSRVTFSSRSSSSSSSTSSGLRTLCDPCADAHYISEAARRRRETIRRWIGWSLFLAFLVYAYTRDDGTKKKPTVKPAIRVKSSPKPDRLDNGTADGRTDGVAEKRPSSKQVPRKKVVVRKAHSTPPLADGEHPKPVPDDNGVSSTGADRAEGTVEAPTAPLGTIESE